ncbi:hypothetical protein QL285_082740 [Trifolium repens]|nr:hypothetical protein QL285_082740 [Trifolium repens]
MVQTNYIENSLKIQSKDLANHGAKRNYMEKKRRSHHHKRFWNVSTLCFLLESTSIELQGPFLHPKFVTLFNLNKPPFIVQENGQKWAKTAFSSPPARSDSPARIFPTTQFACARSGSPTRDSVSPARGSSPLARNWQNATKRRKISIFSISSFPSYLSF